jgi:hypothetical protein
VRLGLEIAGSDSEEMNLVRNDLRSIERISYHNDFPVIGA